jgi:transposase
VSNIYKQGDNRKQQMFFPPSIDEYVGEDNQVRAIDDYVELLDVAKLGFTNATLLSTDGQPAYHPKLLLKIYIYGYINKVRSSRKLEQEIDRNIEIMWLCAGLRPRYKTIANFRKDNATALKKVFREFVLLCKELDLITGELVAVDGAFLRANASKNKLITKKTVVQDLKSIDSKIEEYLQALSFADKEEKKDKALKPLPTNNIPKMTKRKAKLDKDLALLEEMGVTQYNRTDPDAKLMIKPAHNLMAYNVQIAVDKKYRFIVVTDVSSDRNDVKQLPSIASECKEVLGKDKLKIAADTGYYSAVNIKACIDKNITIFVPAQKNNKQKKKGLFENSKFHYDTNRDVYICPNNQELKKALCTQKRGDRLNFVYRGTSSMCNACTLRDKCLAKKTAQKSIYRWEHQEIIEQHILTMNTEEAKEAIKQRSALAEHPFGTIKQTLGWSHFLVRGKEKVSGENALIMFTYNFKRMLNLIGIDLFRKLVIAIKEGDTETIREEIVAYIARICHIWMKYLLESRKILFPTKKFSF